MWSLTLPPPQDSLCQRFINPFSKHDLFLVPIQPHLLDQTVPPRETFPFYGHLQNIIRSFPLHVTETDCLSPSIRLPGFEHLAAQSIPG